MNIAHIVTLLKSWGWTAYKDEVGDDIASLRCNDSSIRVIPNFKQLGVTEYAGMMVSLATDEYSYVCSYIRGVETQYFPLISMWNSLKTREEKIEDNHIKLMADQAIMWAKEQSIEEGLAKHAALPTNAPGARPIYHLASLAILGHVETLKFYQMSFEKGDRLGFVPYIKKDIIDRAYEAAISREDSS